MSSLPVRLGFSALAGSALLLGVVAPAANAAELTPAAKQADNATSNASDVAKEASKHTGKVVTDILDQVKDLSAAITDGFGLGN